MKKILTVLCTVFMLTGFVHETTPKVFQDKDTTKNKYVPSTLKVPRSTDRSHSIKALQSFIGDLDMAFEPILGATLAGLSLASLALIISLASAQDEKIFQMSRTHDQGSEKMNKEHFKLSQLNSAVGNIKLSFYFFIGFLVITLTLDVGEEHIGNILSEIQSFYVEIGDVILSGGLLLSGITYLIKGARNMNKAIPDSKGK